MTCLVFTSLSSRLDSSITMKKQFSVSSKLSGVKNFQHHLSVPFQKLFGKQKYIFIVLSLYSFQILEVHEMGNFNTWRYRFGCFQFLLFTVEILKPVFLRQLFAKWFFHGSSHFLSRYLSLIQLCLKTVLWMAGMNDIFLVKKRRPFKELIST